MRTYASISTHTHKITNKRTRMHTRTHAHTYTDYRKARGPWRELLARDTLRSSDHSLQRGTLHANTDTQTHTHAHTYARTHTHNTHIYTRTKTQTRTRHIRHHAHIHTLHSQLAKLQELDIPVYAFYVKECAQSCFESIAAFTGGEAAFLDVNSATGAAQ
jgi:hypothetical protein